LASKLRDARIWLEPPPELSQAIFTLAFDLAQNPPGGGMKRPRRAHEMSVRLQQIVVARQIERIRAAARIGAPAQ